MKETRKALVFEALREGYGIDQLRDPMTVGELRRLLEEYDDDALFVLSHDSGYTYGSVTYDCRLLEEKAGEYGPEWTDEEDE